jgi:hypothetical protein
MYEEQRLVVMESGHVRFDRYVYMMTVASVSRHNKNQT